MKTSKITPLLLCLPVASAIAAANDPFCALNSRFSGSTQNLHAVTFGADKWVAVGDSGTILASTDSVTWRPLACPTRAELTGIAYGSAGFVAVGDQSAGSGAILTSPDGVVWTQQPSPVTNKLSAVCYGSGVYVAVGSHGMILSSSNGIMWSVHNTGAPNDLNAVAAGYGTTSFIAVGDSGTIMTSVDAFAWTARFSGLFTRLNAVAGGYFSGYVVVGDSGALATSPDGVTWTARYSGVSVDLYAAGWAVTEFSAGLFGLAGGGGTFLMSSNLNNWIPAVTGTASTLRGIVYTNGAFLSVGDSGTLQAGIPWLTLSTLSTQPVQRLAFGNSKYVAVGGDYEHGVIYTSTNQTDWMLAYSNSIGAVEDVAFDGTRFQAGGVGRILNSIDGLNWTAVDLGTTTNVQCLACGDGVSIALGSYDAGSPTHPLYPAALRTTDGVIWNRASPLWSVTSAIFGHALFVAVTSIGGIYTSGDGTAWTLQTSTSSQLAHVIYAAGLFTAVGNGPVVMSRDGINWWTNSNISAGAVAFGNQGFVAAGSDGFVTSLDGTSWTTHPYSQKVLDLVFVGNAYLGVTAQGTVVRSLPADTRAQPLLINPFLGSRGFEADALAEPGYTYRLQRSAAADSGPWVVVTNFTSTQPITHLIDPDATGAYSFYRITSP